ncbi:MAG: hypothetical protein HY744_16555 [Deltaproteobacteria bacterium]|nr:hypothetical protein [Deltaproteobacteria bacterium]
MSARAVVYVHAFSHPARQAAASASAPGGPGRSVLLYARTRAEDESPSLRDGVGVPTRPSVASPLPRDRGRLGEPSSLARKCRERVRAVLAAVALFLAGLAPLGGCEPARLAAFPHRLHLTQKGCGGPGQPKCPGCLDCHEPLRRPEPGPAVATSACAPCHQSGAPSAPGHAPASARAGLSIAFGHAQHLRLPEIAGGCVKCHPGVIDDGQSRPLRPGKPVCVTCHADELNRGACDTCHGRTDLRRLVPQSFVRHDLSFVRDHGLAANTGAKICAKCHTRDDCLACHGQGQTIAVEARRPDAVDRQLLHRGDFVTRHAIEAQGQPATCLRCHSSASCDRCHIERGVSAARRDARRPHPPEWIGPNTASPSFHGRAARRDIAACAACHDQGPASVCIRCHKVGGYGGSPHPPGWRSSRPRSEVMCSYCHAN